MSDKSTSKVRKDLKANIEAARRVIDDKDSRRLTENIHRKRNALALKEVAKCTRIPILVDSLSATVMSTKNMQSKLNNSGFMNNLRCFKTYISIMRTLPSDHATSSIDQKLALSGKPNAIFII